MRTRAQKLNIILHSLNRLGYLKSIYYKYVNELITELKDNNDIRELHPNEEVLDDLCCEILLRKMELKGKHLRLVS